jgi:hypothetical protein
MFSSFSGETALWKSRAQYHPALGAGSSRPIRLAAEYQSDCHCPGEKLESFSFRPIRISRRNLKSAGVRLLSNFSIFDFAAREQVEE